MMFGKIFKYFWRWIVKPGTAAEDQLYDKKNAGIGFWAVFIFAILYSGTALLLHLTGFRPAFAPILPIPKETYYFWQTFFTLPWAVVSWLFAGLIIFLWNRIFTREAKRRISDILGPLGMAFVIPWFFFTWLPETVLAPVFGSWSFPPWPAWLEIIRLTIPALWMAALIYISARKIFDAKWFQCVGSALLGTAAFGLMFILFMR